MSKIINGIVAGQIIDGKKPCCMCKRMMPLRVFKANKIVKCGYHSWCKYCISWKGRVDNKILKMEMIIAYGGKCNCCGEKGLEFLTLEHVNNDGKAYRDEIGGLGIKVWMNLKRRNWPKDDYTILCWNCNCAKKYDKFCMHNFEKYKIYTDKLESYLNSKDRDKYFKLKDMLYD